MIKSIQILYILCLLFFGCTLSTAQNNSYEEYYNIFPSDSVIVSIPKYANSYYYTKAPKNGTTTPSEDPNFFKIKYKPFTGYTGKDTFQVVYFISVSGQGDLVKKSKKVIVKTSAFILNDDAFSVYTSDSNVVLNVYANDILPNGNEKITYLPTPATSKLKISADGEHVILESSPKAISEQLTYVVSNGTSKEIGKFTLTVKDTNTIQEDQVFRKFLIKNTSLTFIHPYDVLPSNPSVNNGNIEITGSKITYTPDSAWSGIDTLILNVGTTLNNADHTFIFKVFDFDQPNVLAIDDYAYTITGQSVSFDVLKNDFAPTLIVDIYDLPSHGTLVKQGNGKYKYTPAPGFSGVDVIVYKACEPLANVCEYATVTLSVSYFAPDGITYLSTGKGSPIKVNYPFPASGYKLSILTSGYPLHGVVNVLDAQKNLEYIPANNFVGLDSMKIKFTLLSNPSIFHIVRIYINVYDIGSTCYEDCVWPGDHNNDGRVDMKDLTFIAPSIGETGAARTNTVNNYWVGQDAENWGASRENVNLKYGDSDGNGLIDVSDTTLLSYNYRNLHGIRVDKGINTLFLPFKLTSDKAYYYPGDEIIITFSIGDDTWPIKNLSGFTSSFTFSEAFNGSTLQGEFNSENWLAEDDKLLQLVKKPFDKVIDFGAARISGKGTAGYGDVAIIKSIVEDELEGFKGDDDDFYYAQIQLNDGTLNIGDNTTLRTAPQVFYIPIKIERKGETEYDKQVKIYPNPTSSGFEIKSNNVDNIIKSVYIYSISGQNIISLDKINQNKVAINLGKYPSGLYLVKTFTTLGVEISKVEKF